MSVAVMVECSCDAVCTDCAHDIMCDACCMEAILLVGMTSVYGHIYDVTSPSTLTCISCPVSVCAVLCSSCSWLSLSSPVYSVGGGNRWYPPSVCRVLFTNTNRCPFACYMRQ